MIRGVALPQRRTPRLSATLSGYIARQFAWRWITFLVGLAAVILMVSSVDLLDRMGNKDGVTLGLIIQMILLKLPFHSQEVMPFTILFAGLATFWRLNSTHELVVARASGVSVWQFLLPALVVSILVGLITVAIFNPIAAVMLGGFEQIETRFSKSQPNALTLSRSGLWLRQVDSGGQSVIHAERVSPETITLHQVIVFRFGAEDRFLGRIDAPRAELAEGKWLIFEAVLSEPGARPSRHAELELETQLTGAKILDSFASPATISFWSLPGFIQLLEKAGFSAQRHRLQWHRLLAVPLLFAAMVLLSAGFSLRHSRRGHVGLIMVLGMLAGFLLYFLSNFVHALGLSGKIPVVLAGWAPAGISLMLGTTMLLHLEDG